MDATGILTRPEVAAVLADLKKRAKRSINSRQNLTIFRLSCCCGLRRKEIAGLTLGDVLAFGPKPVIRIRKENTKGRDGERRSRLVPLWWDAGTLADLQAWKQFRIDAGATADSPFVIRCATGSGNEPMTLDAVRAHWRTTLRVLGPERIRQLSIHKGRHSFCTHALAAGRSLVEVRDAAGHADISTTNIYLHYLERPGVPDLFSFDEE